ncbi:MAG: hypothetical protein NVS1B11_24980 [Terriglobales bacterium]
MAVSIAKRIAAPLLLCFLIVPSVVTAQQSAATGEPIVIRSASLPKGFLRQPYRFQVDTKGGITPLTYKAVRGSLPKGLELSPDGVLLGRPSETGEFGFTVAVTDSGRPAQQKSQKLTLQIIDPLLVKWARPPKVEGQRVQGSLKVSNQTGDDFDLTVVVLAVNESGRATAIGYQHFDLKKNRLDFEIPFGESLPRGTYRINTDVVAEVKETGTIYRSRLVARAIVQQGP